MTSTIFKDFYDHSLKNLTFLMEYGKDIKLCNNKFASPSDVEGSIDSIELFISNIVSNVKYNIIPTEDSHFLALLLLNESILKAVEYNVLMKEKFIMLLQSDKPSENLYLDYCIIHNNSKLIKHRYELVNKLCKGP